MGRGRRRNFKRVKNRNHQQTTGTLSGMAGIMEHPLMETVTKGGLVVLAAIAAGGAGAALGKHSLLVGVPVALLGFHKKNPYIIAAGLGLTLSNGFQNQNKASTVQGMDGFDVKQITAEAKDRVGTFFKNFSEKLYLPIAEPSATNGLLGNDEERVTYFVNPYGTKDLDMSAIDRVQEQIAEMNQGATGGLDESEKEF